MSGSRGSGGKGGGGKGSSRPRAAADRPSAPNRTLARSGAGSSSLYERYKDALRRGHVAALRGRNDAAIEAYQEAASIAPDRALPHASVGGILVKMNRPADAVAAYERALALAPRDETALRGIAETLTRLGRRPPAAEALDRLASTLEAGGRIADATDAARRALELAETPERRTRVEQLTQRLRTISPGDEAAERALTQALKVLETPEPVETLALPAAEIPIEAVAGDAGPVQPDLGEVEGEVVVTETDGIPTEAFGAAAAAADGASEDLEPRAEAGPAASAEPVAEAQPVEPADEADGAAAGGPPGDAISEPAAIEPPEPDVEISEPVGLGIALGAAAEAQLYAGHLAEAHVGLLSAARAHRRAGRLAAALDACYLAIGLAPADPELHLLLTEIYLDRGWRSQAADKLVLLSRLAELDEDPATRERLCAIVAARLPDEPRVAELCA